MKPFVRFDTIPDFDVVFRDGLVIEKTNDRISYGYDGERRFVFDVGIDSDWPNPGIGSKYFIVWITRCQECPKETIAEYIFQFGKDEEPIGQIHVRYPAIWNTP